MRLRPLFILADLEAGGAQRVILTVLRYLDRDNFEPHLGVINNKGPLVKEIPDNVCVHDIGAGRVRYAIPGIIRLCRTLMPETVVSTLGHLNLTLLAIRFALPGRTRLIVREANTPSSRIGHTKHPGLYRFFYRRLYPLADKVICNSKYMKKDLVDFLPLSPQKAAVIPNPVDTQRIDQALANSQNPYEAERHHLVSIGRLNVQKGFDLLLRAFEIALQSLPRLHLTIVGDGAEETSLKKMADDMAMAGSVRFVGHQDNPFPYMAHADLFVSSSRWEGSPNVVLESLACGTPVLAFHCPGGTGEIIREGKNGWLVPNKDFGAMGQKIVEIVKGKRWLEMERESFLGEDYKCLNAVKRYEDLLMGESAENRR